MRIFKEKVLSKFLQSKFEGEIGKEYKLIKLACPHFEELEETISEAIRSHFKNSDQKEISVLEVGCGPGFTTAHIAAADSRVNIVAVDNEALMIAQAEETMKKLIENGMLRLEHSDALEYLKRLQTKSIDCFASGFTLHNFQSEYRLAVLKEIFRTLKSGGLFVNADMYSYDNPKEQATQREWKLNQFRTAFTGIGRGDLATAWSQHHQEDEAPNVIMRENESCKEMAEIGFVNIQTIYRKHLEATIKALKPKN